MKAGGIRVMIATTEGLAAVQKVTAEQAGVPSVACLDGTTEVLPISSDYARFVNRGTGIVAAETGHDAYRLDLDARVHGGLSWQLPVLLAHLLAADGRLADPDDVGATAVVATGVVDRDRCVRPVEGIPEKMAGARERIAELVAEGARVVVIVPQAEDADGADPALAEFGDRVELQRWERIDAWAERLVRPLEGGDEGDSEPAARDGPRVPRRRRGVYGALALIVLLVGSGSVAWWFGPGQWQTLRDRGEYEALDSALRDALFAPAADLYRAYLRTRATPAAHLAFSVTEHRPADGGSCAGLRFRDVLLVAAPLDERSAGYFRSGDDASLCRLTYAVINQGEELFYAYLAALPVGAPGTALWVNAGAVAPNARVTLDVDLRNLPGGARGFDLVAAAAPKPSPVLRRAINAAAGARSDGAATHPGLALARLPDLGVGFATASHAIVRGGERGAR